MYIYTHTHTHLIVGQVISVVERNGKEKKVYCQSFTDSRVLISDLSERNDTMKPSRRNSSNLFY